MAGFLLFRDCRAALDWFGTRWFYVDGVYMSVLYVEITRKLAGLFLLAQRLRVKLDVAEIAAPYLLCADTRKVF